MSGFGWSEMKIRPILFKAEMVRAILEGRKTQTRRVMKPQPTCTWDRIADPRDMIYLWPTDDGKTYYRKCPYGRPGDRLWMRETWAICYDDGEENVMYRADGWYEDVAIPWKPSIFMPRWASRANLEVTNVRVERVQQIDNNDALAEGTPDIRTMKNNYDLRDCYHILWDKINQKRSFGWDVNPWVWVIEFRMVEK